jgi:hypothetical protein
MLALMQFTLARLGLARHVIISPWGEKIFRVIQHPAPQLASAAIGLLLNYKVLYPCPSKWEYFAHASSDSLRLER